MLASANVNENSFYPELGCYGLAGHTASPRDLLDEVRLAERMHAGLSAIDGIRLLGDAPGAERVGLWSFDVDGVHAHDAGQFLDARGIAVRVGHHCAAPLHRRFGMTASVRASLALYNTDEDVDTFLDAVAGIRPYFGADA